MQIVRIVKIKKPLFEIELENSDCNFKTTLDIISEFNLHVNKQISQKEINEISNKTNIELAKFLAIKTVSKKQVTEYELLETLKKTSVNNIEILKIINRIKTLGYLDDIKYANDAYFLMLAKGKGPEYIDNFLSQKGISDEIIKSAKTNTALNDEEQIKQIQTQIKKKFKKSTTKKQFNFSKLLAFFLRKGFPDNLIIKALNELGITGEEYYEN